MAARSPCAPVDAGTYTAVASFAGSADYSSATQSVTFTIAQATPQLKITPVGGLVTSKGHGATASVAGVDGVFNSSLAQVTPTLTYHQGNSASGKVLAVPPVKDGTYTVVASFAGSTDYTAATTSATFTVGKATKTEKEKPKPKPKPKQKPKPKPKHHAKPKG